MSLKSQEILFEALSGMFGWAWLLSVPAALILAGLAIFSDWAWLNVVYALGVGAIGKWLARGFLENKHRVIAERNAADEI